MTSLADRLTPRQRDVYYLVIRGLSNKDIGSRLGLESRTIKQHMTHMLRELNFKSRSQLIVAHYIELISSMELPQGTCVKANRSGNARL